MSNIYNKQISFFNNAQTRHGTRPIENTKECAAPAEMKQACGTLPILTP